jgi:peptidoglycan/xylan/chitin deacetylase (PgdA/CDA1 family)
VSSTESSAEEPSRVTPPADGSSPSGRPPTPTPARPTPSEPLPTVFESPDFFVAVARSSDTAETLAARHLGDANKAWMISEFAGASSFADGQTVAIPRRDWNPVGVYPEGYQLVPVLVYHDIAPERRGKLVIAARTFEEQMRHLKAEGFRGVSLREYLEFGAGRRQLPRKSVLLAFDDGYRSFLQYAAPVLKELGFRATLFVYTDYVGSRNALTWTELRQLAADGFDVQAHSKSHSDLRHRLGESDADFAKRMASELAFPSTLFRRHLGQPSETLAYPYGGVDDEVAQHVAQHGYRAGFTVRRESNPSFASRLRLGRAQIYAEMGLREFARNVTVFHEDRLDAMLGQQAAPRPAPAALAVPGSPRQRLAAPHIARAIDLEQRGHLRQALEQRTIALTIDPRDTGSQTQIESLQTRIERRVSALIEEGKSLLGRGLHGEARGRFLAALALEPTNRTAFEALQEQVREVAYVVHTVRAGETLSSVAELYYGDQLRADVIAETNRLPLTARLTAGRSLRIPEIPGVPFLPR